MIQWAKLSVALAVPFVFMPWMAEVRELPRHTLVQVVAFAALAQAISRGRMPWDREWLRAALLFIAALTAGTLAASSIGRSLFGPYEGHHGALVWLAYAALAATGTADPRRFGKWLGALAAIGVVQAAIGIAQYLGGDVPRGTLGHEMFFAAFLMMSILALLGWWIDATKNSERTAAIIAAVLLIAALVLTGRRGPVLGLGVGLFVLWWLTRKLTVVFGLVAALAILLMFSKIGVRGEDRSVSQRYEELVSDDLQVPEHLDTLAQRRDYARVALELIQERPLFGWGFGSFRDQYAQRKDPGIERYETSPHNVCAK